MNYAAAVPGLAIVLVLLAAAYVVPIALTWRESAHRGPVHWWSRWYALAVIAVGTLGGGS